MPPQPRKFVDTLAIPELSLRPETPEQLTLDDAMGQTLALLSGMFGQVRRLLKVNAADQLLVTDPVMSPTLALVANRLLDGPTSAAQILTAISGFCNLLAASIGVRDGHLATIASTVGGGTPGPLTDIATATAGIATDTAAISAAIGSILTIVTAVYDGATAFRTDEIP